jgi:hypothetical protein
MIHVRAKEERESLAVSSTEDDHVRLDSLQLESRIFRPPVVNKLNNTALVNSPWQRREVCLSATCVGYWRLY